MAEAWIAFGLGVVAAGLFACLGHTFWKVEQAEHDTLWRARNNVPGTVSRNTKRMALAQSGGTQEQTERQTMTRDEVIEMTRRYADVFSLPERVGLGLIWAESDFDPDAYRHTSPEDHSIGLGQQTFRWSEFWTGRYQDQAALNRWKEAYSVPSHALSRAFNQMAGLRRDDHLDWLCRYNKRDGNVTPGVRRRYQLGLNWADEYLREHAEMDTGYEFSGGFAKKAAELQEMGVDTGQPLTGEEQWGSVTAQLTTTGLFVYKSPGDALFLAAVWGAD